MLAKVSKIATSVMLGTLMLGAAGTAMAAENKTVLTLVAHQETAWVKNFNPFLQAGLLHTTRHFIYEPLVIFNDMQGGKPVYRLATNYAFSDDLKSVTIDQREGVKWTDGEAFTADDILFSFNLVKANKALDERSIWTQIKGVEKLGEHKVKFDLAEVNTNVVNDLVLVPIVPEHQWKSVKDPVAFTNDKPVGTGPFTEVDNFSAQLYTQCRNPHYWDNANLAIDCLRMPQMATNDQVLAAVMKGDVDWFGSFVPDIERLYVGNDPKNNKYWFPASGTVAFNVNFQTKNPGNNEAFNDINFRRAFSMAMDRQSMVDIAGYGYPTVNEYPSGLGKAFASWDNPDVEKKYGKYNKFDLEGAKALLKEAGYKDCDGDKFLGQPGSDLGRDRSAPCGHQVIDLCADRLAVTRFPALPFDARRGDNVEMDIAIAEMTEGDCLGARPGLHRPHHPAAGRRGDHRAQRGAVGRRRPGFRHRARRRRAGE